jgi:hypothetical protein
MKFLHSSINSWIGLNQIHAGGSEAVAADRRRHAGRSHQDAAGAAAEICPSAIASSPESGANQSG